MLLEPTDPILVCSQSGVSNEVDRRLYFNIWCVSRRVGLGILTTDVTPGSAPSVESVTVAPAAK